MGPRTTDWKPQLYLTWFERTIRKQKEYTFLPPDAMLSAVFAVARCLSVRHVRILADDIVKRLSPPCSPIILVFWPERRCPISRGTLSAGAQSTRGGRNLRFSTEITFYLRNGTGGYMVAMERYVSVSMTLNDLERRDRRCQIFQADLLNNARTIYYLFIYLL